MGDVEAGSVSGAREVLGRVLGDGPSTRLPILLYQDFATHCCEALHRRLRPRLGGPPQAALVSAPSSSGGRTRRNMASRATSYATLRAPPIRSGQPKLDISSR